MISFDDFDIEEKRSDIIPYRNNGDHSDIVGSLVIVKDDSKYSLQNPTDEFGNKLPGKLTLRKSSNGYIFRVTWDDYYNNYRPDDLEFVEYKYKK